MRPTLDYIYEKFEYFNKLCFGGLLPVPPISFNLRYGQMGVTRYRSETVNGENRNSDFSIELSIRRDLPEEEYMDTLIHEMIHYYIAFNNWVDDSTHGCLFRQKMNEIITTYNFKVTVAFSQEEENLINLKTRFRYVCVAEFFDGRTAVGVVAKNKVFRIWEILSNETSIIDVKWYVSDRAIFEKFPVLVSPKLQYVDVDKIHHYLKGAKELIKTGNFIQVGI